MRMTLRPPPRRSVQPVTGCSRPKGTRLPVSSRLLYSQMLSVFGREAQSFAKPLFVLIRRRSVDPLRFILFQLFDLTIFYTMRYHCYVLNDFRNALNEEQHKGDD